MAVTQPRDAGCAVSDVIWMGSDEGGGAAAAQVAIECEGDKQYGSRILRAGVGGQPSARTRGRTGAS